MCVFTESLFLSPGVASVQVKKSKEHAVLFKKLNPHVIAIVTETEGGEKCHFEMCILSDTAFFNVCAHVLF